MKDKYKNQELSMKSRMTLSKLLVFNLNLLFFTKFYIIKILKGEMNKDIFNKDHEELDGVSNE